MASPQPTPVARAAAHLFAGLQDWIEVFRAGTHTDSKGKGCTFTTGDLDEMVANVSLGKPPAVLGHPEHNDPAYGWGELKRDGESLFARFDDVNPAFEAGVKTGAYRNRSVSVIKDKQHGWRVRHIGWLGAAPPAIDGLKPVSFTADESAEQHEFANGDDMTMSWALSDVAGMLRGVREWVIGKDGLETADRVLPDYRITSVSDAATRLRERADTTLYTASPTDPSGTAMSLTQADLDRAATETEQRVRTEMQSQFNAQTEELAQLKRNAQTSRINTAITGWKAAGKLLPAEEAGLAEFMAGLENATGGSFEFTAAGATAPTKKTLAEFFAEFMGQRKPLVQLGQVQAGNDSNPEPGDGQVTNKEISERARNYQAKQEERGIRISIGDAITAVTEGKDKAG